MPPFLTITQAAELAHTSRQRVYNAIARGELTRLVDMPVPLLDAAQVRAWAALPVPTGGKPYHLNGGRPRKATRTLDTNPEKAVS